MAIADVVGRHDALMQNVMNFGGDYDGEMDLIRKEAEKHGCFSVMALGEAQLR